VFAASGIFGQAMHIDSNEKMVIVMHSAREKASAPADWALQYAFFMALTERVRTL
jgi:CubicO group peptidase (beta-lactamase class C family)